MKRRFNRDACRAQALLVALAIMAGGGAVAKAGTSPAPQAQTTEQRTIRGTVVDATGEPLIGATILVPGTSFGASTDLDGNFTVKLGNAK